MDDAVRVVEAPDRFLREMRLARGRAATTKAYAEGVSLYLRWCDRTGRDWRTAARDKTVRRRFPNTPTKDLALLPTQMRNPHGCAPSRPTSPPAVTTAFHS
ncbi:hypothetical protein GCM10010251_94000 [Streptomyces aurantiogriseus]|uniref:Core-binding (CB) domain-containing protein n=1 Tax=Streptomyces aurantiogriseus TaxID=66870 RepID=A0A918L0L1_9ACTN|nr:hypothetical protein GCM10010251_94000 [Streptomyces aurantiogriseus]